jgi:hypothetical protein
MVFRRGRWLGGDYAGLRLCRREWRPGDWRRRWHGRLLGATALKARLGYDDSLDVFGVHAISGIVGALLNGVFATKSIGGAESSMAIQAIGVVATVIYAAIMTTVILIVAELLVGVRVTPEQEKGRPRSRSAWGACAMSAHEQATHAALENQAFSLMGRLHVTLRRQNGRVTDIEYMRIAPCLLPLCAVHGNAVAEPGTAANWRKAAGNLFWCGRSLHACASETTGA